VKKAVSGGRGLQELEVRPFAAADREWATRLMRERWAGETVAVQGSPIRDEIELEMILHREP